MQCPRESVLGSMLFNVVINDLHKGIDGMPIKFAADTKLEGTDDTLDVKAGIQKDKQEY